MAGYNGTPSSGVAYSTTTYKFGSASLSTPTSAPGAYITLPAGPATNASTWAWECWFKSSVTPSAVSVIVGAGTTGSSIGYIGVAATGGKPVFNIYAGNATITGTTSICDGNWHHLALVANGSSGFVGYVDGVSVGTNATVAVGQAANALLFIGALNATDSFPALNAYVDEVAIWQTARYTATFTPPTAAYTGNEGMVALYHLDSNANDSSTNTVTVTTPASQIQLATYTLAGTYLGVAPTGISYAYNGGSTYTALTGFTASGGNWSGTATAPLATGATTVTVQESNSTGTTATSGSFTVTASSTPAITVNTPSNTTVGASIPISGTYVGTAPTGINYYYDATGSYVAATGFAASAGNWAANTATDAPAAGSHTITVQESNSTGTTATSGSFTTSSTGVAIAPNNAAFVYSPYNWTTPTSGSASTVNAGAYFRVMFSGSSVTLNFNVTNNSAPLSQIYYRIDGYETQSPWTMAPVAAAITPTMPTNTTALPYHLLEVVVKSTSETINRWNSPSNTAVVFTGLTLAAGGGVLAPAKLTKNILMFGDSITEGVRTVNYTATNDTDRNDCMMEWSWLVGKAMGGEFGIVGFGGSGFTVTGSGNVPVCTTSWFNIMSGVSRTFSPAPDMIIINEGTNDSGATSSAVTAAATAALNALVAATTSKTLIVVLENFGNYQTAAIQAAVAAVNTPRVIWLSTAGFFNLAYGDDNLGLHPSGPNAMGLIGPQTANVLRPLLDRASRSYVFG